MTASLNRRRPALTAGLSRGLVALIAVATGAVVANLYYAQPVLHQVAHDFHSGSGLASLIITATQVGYAAGLLLVVPLGDLYPRRVLVVRIFGVAAVALVACAAGPRHLDLRAGLGGRGGRLGGRAGHDPLRRRPGPGRAPRAGWWPGS